MELPGFGASTLSTPAGAGHDPAADDEEVEREVVRNDNRVHLGRDRMGEKADCWNMWPCTVSPPRLSAEADPS